MLATRAANKADLPRGHEWCYEVTWDGVSALRTEVPVDPWETP